MKTKAIVVLTLYLLALFVETDKTRAEKSGIGERSINTRGETWSGSVAPLPPWRIIPRWQGNQNAENSNKIKQMNYEYNFKW